MQKIQVTSKDYDDAILKNDTDISQMYSNIKETIVSQDEQIMQILTSLFKNQKVINSSLSLDMIAKLKENIIVYGSTGTGKTEILKRIANIYKIPIVIEDATSLSETGYVGRNIEDMLENLYAAAGEDIEKAQKGILVIDEFDKLAESGKSFDHISRIGVQRSLLKLLDGPAFYFKGKKFDTSKLSIVALRAFTGIVESDDYSNVSTTKQFPLPYGFKTTFLIQVLIYSVSAFNFIFECYSKLSKNSFLAFSAIILFLLTTKKEHSIPYNINKSLLALIFLLSIFIKHSFC